MRRTDDNPAGGHRLKGRSLYVAAAVSVALIGGTMLGYAATRTQSAAVLESEPTAALPVATLSVQLQPGYETRRLFVGRVEPSRESASGFELGGLLEAVAVDEGDQIKAGQVLARLDTARLEAQRQERAAALEEARANRALARITVRRLEGVIEAGGISRQGLDEAREAYRAAKAAESLARSRIQTLDVDLAKATLTAPYDGVVTKRHVDEGQVLPAGSPVVTLQERASRELRVGVAGPLVDTVAVGQRYPVQVRDRTLSGRVKAVLPFRGAGTRTVDVILTLEEAGLRVRSGDLASLELRETVPEDGYWLPTGSLAEGARGLWTVYVLEPVRDPDLSEYAAAASHRIVPYLVEVLHQESDRVFVRSDLAPGTQVVADGLQRVVPGQLVRLSTAEAVQLARGGSRNGSR
ncbi:MAG: efflux RND transporter periplasmic adaptor subunit [Gammaproteobacteria bacterium]|nr:efflux RND transporter periplasmic adaptor subunit [Gammaproteobacteria bacterium]